MPRRYLRLTSPLLCSLLLLLNSGCRRNNPSTTQSDASDAATPSDASAGGQSAGAAAPAPHEQNPQRARQFNYAVSDNDIATVRQMLKDGADPNEVADFGLHAITEATLRNSLEMMTLLLDAGAKVDPEDNGPGTPLISAALRGYVPAMELLLKHGAKVEGANGTPSSGFFTPLDAAAKGGHADAVRCLIKAGANPNAGEGSKPLYLASVQGNLESVTELLQAGASLKDPDSGEYAPLIGATLGAEKSEHWDVARLLIEKGANPNAANFDGKTALHAASLRHEVDMVQFLLAHGAKPDMKDASGRTPADMAALNTMDKDPARGPQVIKLLTSPH